MAVHSVYRAVAISALCLACSAVNAQVSYNGDFRGGDTNVTQADTVSDMMVFDDVNVLSPHLTTIWGNFFIYQQYLSSSLGLTYEIRTGITAGHAGTLIASGSVSNLQQTLTGRSTQNNAYREVQLLGTVNINLTPGVYWIGLQNNEGANPPAQWTSFLAQTLGNDAGPAGDPNPAPQNTLLDGSSYATGTELGDYVQQGADFSMGVTSVPETPPGLMLAAGTIGLIVLRRRKVMTR